MYCQDFSFLWADLGEICCMDLGRETRLTRGFQGSCRTCLRFPRLEFGDVRDPFESTHMVCRASPAPVIHQEEKICMERANRAEPARFLDFVSVLLRESLR